MSSRLKLALGSAVFLILLVTAGIYLRRMSVRPVRVLPSTGTFSAFSLPDASGRMWRNADLRGSIWIASSLPSSCSSCAVTELKMADLQTSLEKAREVRLVSFVSDPALRDAPRLSELAREFGARPGKWIFLSGSGGSVPEGRALLIDTEGRIRGGFEVSSPEFSSDVLDAVGDLMREHSEGQTPPSSSP
ncbi:MAG: hypothetical protein ACRD16_08590 [Thermoanaerobaculia bacterium]